MIVVSDTTAISTLYLIGQLSWLEALFGKVLIPKSVYLELLELESVGHDLRPIQEASWLLVEEVLDQTLVNELQHELDRGESEAIALAIQTNADYLLIDERRGNKKATELGVATIGLLRVLLALKSKNIIKAVKPVLDKIQQEGGFWMNQALYNRVLKAADEV